MIAFSPFSQLIDLNLFKNIFSSDFHHLDTSYLGTYVLKSLERFLSFFFEDIELFRNL